MSNLTSIEKTKLESFLGMSSGYILDFSNRTLKEFILENTNLDIYDTKYEYSSGSKANRLRAFWKEESNYIVGNLIETLLEYWSTQKLLQSQDISPSEQKLFDECKAISKRLLEEISVNEEADNIKLDVHFEKIQQQITEQIQSAKFTIWVAVAWFTDNVLFEHLILKNKQGVNVQLIIIDDDINGKSGLNYEKEFETYRIRKTGRYENMMHNKFCIIDLKTVIHGSYNWTKKAQYNNEAITVLNNYKKTEEFADQFIHLKNNYRNF
jgi:phosphatidylserine/phosphatidylglycerophosphate/cardiolipin synthase-like enzyme